MQERFMEIARARTPIRAAIVAGLCSAMVAGCAAPLIMAGISGAGMAGGMGAIGRHQRGSDDMLRSITASYAGGSADDILMISEKHWRHGVVHWIATTRQGERFQCEWGTANQSCARVAS